VQREQADEEERASVSMETSGRSSAPAAHAISGTQSVSAQPSRLAGKVRSGGGPAVAPGAAVASFAGPWGACLRPRGM